MGKISRNDESTIGFWERSRNQVFFFPTTSDFNKMAWKFHHETKVIKSCSEGETTMVFHSWRVPSLGTIFQKHTKYQEESHFVEEHAQRSGGEQLLFGGQKPTLLGESGFDFSYAMPNHFKLN